MQVLPRLRGAFCLVFMDDETLYAARDPQGVRPLVLGRLESGWVVASETAALDIVGASFVREVAPGELISIDENGLRSRSFAKPDPKGCLFEYVYLARPDTMISGRRLHSTRVEVGRTLAKEFPVEADLVIPVPESGTPAAIGFAEQSGIPYGQGLVKNSYVGRTFIQPSQTIRQLGIRLKLNPLRDVIARQAPRGRRRLDRPRQHPARAGPDAARGRRGRDPRPDLVAARQVAVLLRHRLRLARRADRHRAQRRGDLPLDRRGLARATSASTAWSPPPSSPRTSSAGPASTGSTRSSCRWRSASARASSRTAPARPRAASAAASTASRSPSPGSAPATPSAGRSGGRRA